MAALAVLICGMINFKWMKLLLWAWAGAATFGQLQAQALVWVKKDCKPLKGAIQVTPGVVWDDLLGEKGVKKRWLKPGFTVWLASKSCDSFLIGQGRLTALAGDTQLHLGFVTDFCDRGIGTDTALSPIQWKITGRKGKRILKVEWRNVGFFDEWSYSGQCMHRLSFQIWLREYEQRAELRLGKRNLSMEQALALAGFLGEGNATAMIMAGRKGLKTASM